jgi:hypothetical protein
VDPADRPRGRKPRHETQAGRPDRGGPIRSVDIELDAGVRLIVEAIRWLSAEKRADAIVLAIRDAERKGLIDPLLSRRVRRRDMAAPPAGPACKAGADDYCDWEGCPQARDQEPYRTGRHCPLDRATS